MTPTTPTKSFDKRSLAVGVLAGAVSGLAIGALMGAEQAPGAGGGPGQYFVTPGDNLSTGAKLWFLPAGAEKLEYKGLNSETMRPKR